MNPEGKDQFPSQFGRYTLVERLATGGMAEVFKAKIVSAHGFEKLLVIKRILPHLAADKTFVSMFIDEAKLTAELVHPKIVQVTDFGEVAGQYFIALEFVEGFDALALLRTAATKQIRIPIPICMFICIEVLDALDYAHNARGHDGKPMRLVHRDISPSNVFISRRGDVKLGDFGIAHAQERESKTQAGTLKGKYGYMSPEQVVGGSLDGRSDLFAVGIVLAEMLMSRRLFTAPNDLDVLLMVRDGRLERLDKYCKDIPPELDQIVRRALKKRVAERFQTAAEFRDALADLLFRLGFRVGPPDVGRLASDFFDASPEATARVREQAKRWEIRTPPRPAPAGATPAGGTPLTSPTVAVLASAGDATLETSAPPLEPGEQTATLERPAAKASAADPDESLEVLIDDEIDAPAAAPGSAPRPAPRSPDPTMVAALDNALSQPLSVVELDRYQEAPFGAPGAAAPPTPGTPAGAAFPAAPGTPPRISAPGSGATGPGASRPASGAAPPDMRVYIEGRVPDSSGELAIISPVRAFADLAVAQETGVLRFEAATQIKDVFLVRGAPESVNSNVNGDRFGSYLVSRGFIRMADLDNALANLERFSGKLGDAVVGLGLMKPLDVFRLLSQHVRERVMELFGWGEGSFQYYRHVRNPVEAFPLGLDSFEILGAGVLTLSHEHLTARFMPLLDFRARAVPQPRISPEAFRLGPTPREVWALFDGRRTLREQMSRFGTPSELQTFMRMTYLLLETDLARLE